jgi:hypothetical protein
MSDTWRLVVVALAAGVVVEGVMLVAVMRQIGELLLHGAPTEARVHHGPRVGEIVEVPDREPTGRPLLVLFTSSECERCAMLAPWIQRMHAVYGPEADNGHQLDVLAALTDRNIATRAEHALQLGSFARTDLVALMQEWDVPGTPFAVALDGEDRIQGAEAVNTRMQLEMLAVSKLGIVWVAPPEATVEGGSLLVEHAGPNGSTATEVMP